MMGEYDIWGLESNFRNLDWNNFFKKQKKLNLLREAD